jgi:integral membrane protein (TIGR00529 family)
MPGGALFSAPMVRSAAGEARLSGGFLSAVNYWFRHIWEHWWPLYPGVILAMTLTQSRLDVFAAFQIPLGISMAVSGLLIFRGAHADLRAAGPPAEPGARLELLRATSSIWIILLAWGATSAVLRLTGLDALPVAARSVFEKYVPITLGLIVSLVWTARLNDLGPTGLRQAFARRSPYLMAILVLSVMVFRHMLQATEAAPRIAGELTALRVPLVLVVMTLPFVAGLVTGLAVGFVGTSFPIVLALAATLASDDAGLRPYIALAYAFGHLGQMLSPLHLCHIVSNRYFDAGYTQVYRRILPSAAATAVLSGGYFLFLRWLTGSG